MKVRTLWKPTAKQKKAMNEEIYRQIFENVQKLTLHIEALMLWQLHEQLGFGKKRLMRFYNAFVPAIQEMQDYYELHDAEDAEWLCNKKLKDLGIDLAELNDVLNIRIEYK